MKFSAEANAPAKPVAMGNAKLLNLWKIALFCSARCPGDAILRAYDQAAKWRDEGRCIVSGFHSPIESECLSILLRGNQPIIICPARGIGKFRVPEAWKSGISGGRILVLSCFSDKICRVTRETARRRNEFVAALANEVCILYAAPGSQLETLSKSANGRPTMSALETHL